MSTSLATSAGSEYAELAPLIEQYVRKPGDGGGEDGVLVVGCGNSKEEMVKATSRPL